MFGITTFFVLPHIRENNSRNQTIVKVIKRIADMRKEGAAVKWKVFEPFKNQSDGA